MFTTFENATLKFSSAPDIFRHSTLPKKMHFKGSVSIWQVIDWLVVFPPSWESPVFTASSGQLCFPFWKEFYFCILKRTVFKKQGLPACKCSCTVLLYILKVDDSKELCNSTKSSLLSGVIWGKEQNFMQVMTKRENYLLPESCSSLQ